jgi:hypothetical protein
MGAESIVRKKRFENWPARLSDYLAQRQNMPFEWGTNDCIFLAVDCALALTGVDFGAPWRGTYSTKMGAARIIKEHDNSLDSLISSVLGDPIPHALKAMRGDAVLHDFDGVTCGGIVDDTGRRVAFITEDKGLIRVPLAANMRVWRYS